MTKKIAIALLALSFAGMWAAPVRAKIARAQISSAAPANDNDQTLRALHDEMERSKARLKLPGVDKPFYIQYRLMDIDIKNITSSFGALLISNGARNRFMSVDVRVGDYHLDSSNFISEEGFQGFLGSTGQVGIDRDYSSLRQDLWLATDQAYKAAATQYSLKMAFLRSLTKPPEIDDFAKQPPVVRVDPRIEPDWTSRNWDQEARDASAVLKNFPEIYGSRVNYSLIYVTTYLVTSEGTTVRMSHSLAAIEGALDTQAEDGMPLHEYYAAYASRPAELPDAKTVSDALEAKGALLMKLRESPLVPDYTGPVLFDASASGAVLAQVLGPSLSGARPPLSMTPEFDMAMERFGGRSEWVGRVGTRVLPTNVSVVDDPTIKDFQGTPLLGGFDIDDEGITAQRIAIVENGVLKGLLMSRRPGPDFQGSNGHARSADLSDTNPAASNLFFQASDGLSAADMQKKFIDACKDDGQQWCIEVKRMDNPALSSVSQQDFSDFIGEVAGGIATGERVPLEMYRVYVSDGHTELVRGGTLEGLSLREMRNMLAIGSDSEVYTYMQNSTEGFSGTALASFGAAQGGIPSTVVAPSLLLDDIEVRGFHGEPLRVPIVAAPPFK